MGLHERILFTMQQSTLTLRHIITLCLVGAAALPLLAGCGGGGGGDNGNPITGTTGTGSTGTGTAGTAGIGTSGGGVTSVSIVEPNGLTASLFENTNSISVGGSVIYTLTLTNTTAAAVAIHYSSAAPTAPPAGIVVRDPSGNQVPGGVPGPPPLDNTTLAPGQTFTSTETFSGYAVSGTYNATATFTDGATFATLAPLPVAVH